MTMNTPRKLRYSDRAGVISPRFGKTIMPFRGPGTFCYAGGFSPTLYQSTLRVSTMTAVSTENTSSVPSSNAKSVDWRMTYNSP